MVGRGR